MHTDIIISRLKVLVWFFVLWGTIIFARAFYISVINRDKILVLATLVIMLTEPSIFGLYGLTLGKIVGGVGVSVIVAREMTVSVLRMIAATKNRVLAAEKVGKYKTFITDVAILVLLVATEFTFLSNALFHVGFALYVISVILTVYSGIFYILKNKDVFN
jgi:CDP-diacylglycerol--glycerol-3-phosphate 3-phosphatidyltransferase